VRAVNAFIAAGAADLHEQNSLQVLGLLVVGELVDHADAVAVELLRPMADFAGFARRPEGLDGRGDGALVEVERDRNDLPGAGELALDEPVAPGPMWQLTQATRRGRVLIGREFGFMTVWQVWPQKVGVSM